MSLYLGKDDSDNPLLHMTSGTRTPAELKSGSYPDTIFDSRMPYLTITARYLLTRLPDYAGAKVFDITDVASYFSTTSEAFIVILEDSSGGRWVHTPSLRINSQYGSGSGRRADACGAVCGQDYSLAFLQSETDLIRVSQNGVLGQDPVSFTFHTLDSTDTVMVVSRIPYSWSEGRRRPYDWTYGSYVEHYGCGFLEKTAYAGPSLPWQSNNDVVSAEVLFLNVTNSSSTFSVKSGNNTGGIKLSPNEFTLGQKDISEYAPLLSRGVLSSGVVSPLTTNGDVLPSTPIGNLTAKVNGGVLDRDAACLEIANIPPSGAFNMSLSENKVERDSIDIINEVFAKNFIFYKDSVEVELDINNMNFYKTYSTITNTVPTTVISGGLGGAGSEDIILCSIQFSANENPTDIMLLNTNATNRIFRMDAGAGVNGSYAWGIRVSLYIDIDSSGNITCRRVWDCPLQLPLLEYTSFIKVGSITLSLGNPRVRLIRVGPRV